MKTHPYLEIYPGERRPWLRIAGRAALMLLRVLIALVLWVLAFSAAVPAALAATFVLVNGLVAFVLWPRAAKK
jgi:hypothetical protein